ncbi:MAG: ribonuclease R [Eubacteriales bacterium]|nr:ribonuclease R [Eubacteriales bacterium]
MNNLYEKRKQTVYDLICDRQYVPMKIKEIAILMQVAKEDRRELEEILEDLQREGKIELTKRGKYKKAESERIIGSFIGNAKGFGFVETADQKEDIFISEADTNGAIHGDTVEAEVIAQGHGRRREGRIIKILSHSFTEVVGTYEKCSHYGFVVPDNRRLTRDIFIPQEASMGAVDGHKVVAELTDYGDASRKPEGRIVRIIGHKNDPGTDILSIAYACELPVEFPERVLNQAQRAAKAVTPADMEGRLDLRDVCMVTIDGEDAKDLDDAVSVTYDEGQKLWHLGVHIADVSNYVQENSALDREALRRGTSVYLTDRVIPMLPHILSNGICSLNEKEDRLALSCLMDIDEKGNVVGHQIAETVICVRRRMTYTSVKKILTERDEAEIKEYEELVPMFCEMEKLALVLRKKRKARGAIDFDFAESRILLNEQGRPVEILPHERNTATKMIEDFMLLANETVAQDYYWQELPFLYRTHENPDPDKIRQLCAFVANFGYGMKGGGELHPKELQKLLTRIEDSPEEALISRLTLRSMKQARYTPQCTGHFGLAAKYYCHFTSPIRRYPDLQIHRIIKENLRGRMNSDRILHYESILPQVAEQCSRTERRAEEAERDADKMKKAEYMRAHVGEIYDGVISGMNAYGFYVELPNTIEGMVHVSSLYDDRYYYDEKSMEMYGAETGTVYRMGQRVKVCVTDADKEMRTIDFRIVSEKTESIY